jgi:phosphoglycerate dehydrogenase-like enzyme
MASNGTPAKAQDVDPQSGKLEMGIIGLGRMGGNMVKRLAQRGHRIIGYARTAETVARAPPRSRISSASCRRRGRSG